jgi:hypothetical protein
MVISWGFHGIMIDYNWLVVEPTPLKKTESQLGLLFPINQSINIYI